MKTEGTNLLLLPHLDELQKAEKYPTRWYIRCARNW